MKPTGVYLPVPLGVAAQAGQRGQAQVAGAAPGQRLHEQRLVGAEVHHSHLVVEQLWNREERNE